MCKGLSERSIRWEGQGYNLTEVLGRVAHAHAQSSSVVSSVNDEERPLENENPDIIEDYEQQAEEAALYHDDYLSKDPDSGDEDEEDGDFGLVQPYKDIICGSWAAGRGPAIAFVIIAAYSLWAFIVDFQRALPLFIVEMIVLGIVLTSKATDVLVPQKKADMQDRTVEFCTETLVCAGFAVGSLLDPIFDHLDLTSCHTAAQQDHRNSLPGHHCGPDGCDGRRTA